MSKSKTGMARIGDRHGVTARSLRERLEYVDAYAAVGEMRTALREAVQTFGVCENPREAAKEIGALGVAWVFVEMRYSRTGFTRAEIARVRAAWRALRPTVPLARAFEAWALTGSVEKLRGILDALDEGFGPEAVRLLCRDLTEFAARLDERSTRAQAA